tara:strand:+ start:9336 stop:10865 length:1530 start_codon:yes stop_codon:yes gene_type:complete
MELIIVAILAILIGLSFGIVGGLLGRKIISKNKLSSAELKALQIVESAKEEEKALIIKAKEQALKVQSERDSEYRERRSEISQVERRLSNREDNLERRSSNIERRERTLSDKNKEADQLRTELETIKDQELEKLEEISSLSIVEARSNIMEQAQQDIEHELAVYFREEEEKAKEEANSKARTIVSEAIQRLASDVVSEASLTSVPLPSDDMKGRIIGREGRNIRAIEKSTGVDIIIDDNPEAVTLSCFDPIRREIARMSMTKLIADGRIHPARIEEIVQKSGKELDEIIRKSGESAVIEVGIRGLNAELTRLLGRLKYRFSYGENVLLHSMEVAHLAGMMASEIGADIKVSKMGGLLHDIGKALTHEIEGPHAEIGADVAARNKVPKHICSTIAEHHDDDHSSPESFIVAAADAISAARPGSRRDTVEHYIKRLEALEEVGHGFDGVEKCFAIQAGREIRIMVTPESIDDIAANKMAREVSKKIEETLTYPGQIKVTVIRESRSVEYAR